MNNVMLDLETMGTESDAAIVAIGAVRFSFGDAGITNQFSCNVDLASSMRCGLSLSAATIHWWITNAATATWRSSPIELHRALENFRIFLTPELLGPPIIWSKGPAFDTMILSSAYKRLKMEVPWSFRNCRCVRTMNGLAPKAIADLEHHGEHTALADAVFQARCVIAVWRYLNK